MATSTLPRRLRLFYGIGEFGQQFSLCALNYFLLYFYTDVLGISTAAAGVLMLVAKFWDGINDPIMGLFIDRSKPGKGGKCRPFLLRWAVPAGVFLWLLFNAPNLSPTMKLVYAYITYFGQDLCYTATGIAYTTLQARIASDPQHHGLHRVRRVEDRRPQRGSGHVRLQLRQQDGSGHRYLFYRVHAGCCRL